MVVALKHAVRKKGIKIQSNENVSRKKMYSNVPLLFYVLLGGSESFLKRRVTLGPIKELRVRGFHQVRPR